MGNKYPRWTYVVIFALLAIVVVVTARALVGKKSGGVALTPPVEQNVKDSTGKELSDKDRQILDLKSEVAELRKETEANSSRVKELEARLDETSKALAAAQQKLKVAQKQAERAPAAPAPKTVARNVEPAPTQAKTKTAVKNSEPSQPPRGRRPAEPGTYEIIQDTAVLEKPSSSAREVALVQKGMTVNVVGSEGDWLLVRSKHGKPPGYIRRDDAMFRQTQGDIR
jgi:FtsZ-interacting cell division protein ZipA